MKKLLTVTLLVSLLVSVSAACRKQESAAVEETQATAGSIAVSEAAADEAVTIQFWNSAEGNVGVAINGLVDDFNKTIGAEKGIYVEAVFQGSDVMEKLKTLAQAKDFKNFPDVGQIYSAGIPTLVRMDPTVYVDDIYASGKYEITVPKEDIVENFRRTYTYENKQVAIPLNSSSMLLYYNKDAAREAGLDAEVPPSTIAELANWTEALTVRNGDKIERYGLNIQVDRYEFVNYLCGIGGVNYIGDQEGGRTGMMTKLTIGEDGSLKKFLTEWQKVIDTGGYKPVNDDEKEEFATGVSAMNFQSTSQLQTMIALTEGRFELGVAALPRCTEEDTAGAAVGGGSLCMFDLGDENRMKASWEFLQYMASPEVQLKLHLETGYLPVNENTYNMAEMKAHLEDNPLSKVAIDQMRISDPGKQEPFDLINWELNTLVQTNLIDFAEGNVSKEQCHDNIVDGFNAKLAEYIRANQ